jgi:His/Glu/Gln/Arg/opine family amino acid ABC transporter permease subunit
MYSFNLRVLLPYMPKFEVGLLLTLEISTIALLISIPLGFVGALMRISQHRSLRAVALAYVEAIRNVPLLVVLYILFYSVPQYGVRLSAITAGVLALAINSTAFTIEIFRGALAAIATGQYEAAASLGLRRAQVLRLVIFPQVLRIALPSLGNQVVSVVLGSSVAAIVGVPELTYQTLSIGSINFRYFELFVVAAVLYILAVQIISGVWRLFGYTAIGRGPGP